jgi:hydroxyethylthiazole kinase
MSIDHGAALERMRSAAPLIQNITNFVAMNPMANVLLAAGASPAMVHAQEEVEEFGTSS